MKYYTAKALSFAVTAVAVVAAFELAFTLMINTPIDWRLIGAAGIWSFIGGHAVGKDIYNVSRGVLAKMYEDGKVKVEREG